MRTGFHSQHPKFFNLVYFSKQLYIPSSRKILAKLLQRNFFQTGTWTYSLFNKGVKPQLLTVTVTTRARSPTTQPLMATAHMSQSTAQYPSPMIVYARVSQGFLPVLGANVTAVIESETGHQVTLVLWDNGAGNGACIHTTEFKFSNRIL